MRVCRSERRKPSTAWHIPSLPCVGGGEEGVDNGAETNMVDAVDAPPTCVDYSFPEVVHRPNFRGYFFTTHVTLTYHLSKKITYYSRTGF